MLKLNDTVANMTSDNYKDRFIAEYQQLVIRISGLNSMIQKMKLDRLDFKPNCPLSTYELQLRSMLDYKAILEARSVMENIDLSNVFE